MADRNSTPKTERLERLMQISRHLGSSQELDTLLQSTVDAAAELTDSESSSIMFYEAETDLLKFVAGSQSQKDILKRIRVPLEKSIAGRVYKERKPIFLHNADTDDQMFRDVEKALSTKVISLIAVPMVFHGETIGVIEAVNKHNRAHYTEEDLTILETLASQAAVSILSTLMLEETRRAYEELEGSEKKKTDFIAIASHELRTPLGLILGHASYLYDMETDESKKSQLAVIVRSATRLKKIIEDLSNISSSQSGTARLAHEKVDLSHLIRESVASFQNTADNKRISLNSKLPHGMCVYGDHEKLALALNNLIENALVFTEWGGHVWVSAERLPGYAKVSVIDNGIGIPAKDVSRVFERFYQVEGHLTRRHGGMGLGLSVAKAMVEMHNGQIWCESVEGKGSNFSFLLPMPDDRPRQTGPLEPPPPVKPFVD